MTLRYRRLSTEIPRRRTKKDTKNTHVKFQIQAGLAGAAPPQAFSVGSVSGLDTPTSGQPNQPEPYSASTSSEQPLPDFLRPSTSYIPPTSGVFFGQVVDPPSLLTFFPPRHSANYLLDHYFRAVHPIARCVHRPSLETQYQEFWDEAAAGYEPRAPIQAVIFAAWFSAAVALDEATISREFGLTKDSLVDSLKMGTELALSKANFLRTTRMGTMQAFVMYLVSANAVGGPETSLLTAYRYRFVEARYPEHSR